MNHFFAYVLLCGLLASSTVSAAILQIDNGQLTGANEVDIDGTLFNVQFVDGTCIALFSGCDSVADFDFQTQARATQASQALLDQVFLDGIGRFDSQPILTNGCDLSNTCFVFTPWEPTLGGRFGAAIAENHAPPNPDRVDPLLLRAPSVDLAIIIGTTFAKWTPSSNPPVPTPDAGFLMLTGLLGIAGYRWNRRRTR